LSIPIAIYLLNFFECKKRRNPTFNVLAEKRKIKLKPLIMECGGIKEI